MIGQVTSRELKTFPMELGFCDKLPEFEAFSFVITIALLVVELLRGVMFFRSLVD